MEAFMRRLAKALLTVLIALLVLIGATVGFLAMRHRKAAAQVEQAWEATQVKPIVDLGTTQSLEIIPLVDEMASGTEFQSEHGVSYLIKTDGTTILFDVGQNANATDPSPLQANMKRLGIRLDDVEIIVISHNHPDHTGGANWWRSRTFSLGNQQVDLGDKPAYVPTPLTYPGLTPVVADQPQKIAEGVATLGTIPFTEVWQLALFQPHNVEQAIAVNVAGRGLVIITGCGHQTLPKLIARTEMLFDEPIAGVVGGLHYGNAEAQALQPDIQRLRALQPELIALSPHDSEAAARQAFRDAFPDVYQDIMVGRSIRYSATLAANSTAK
jgi:7,8-dihydropterin-6-yl-methyl-4-(beta-D-ribofuranosyl)aminobenzene 5'-phosphate synthase